MVTNVYYYNYYAPYILSNYRRKKIADFPRGEIFMLDEDETYVLNKALKKEVVNYAAEFSGVVNGLKDSSKNIIRDARGFLKNEREEGYITAVRWLGEDLADFVNSYNKSKAFAAKNKDSRFFIDFSDNLAYDLSVSLKALSGYRISGENNGRLSFDENAFAVMTRGSIRHANRQNLPFFEHIYDSTGDFLKTPLSEHMNFKDLKYYYNYKTGVITRDSFAVIGSGMIVNEVV